MNRTARRCIIVALLLASVAGFLLPPRDPVYDETVHSPLAIRAMAPPEREIAIVMQEVRGLRPHYESCFESWHLSAPMAQKILGLLQARHIEMARFRNDLARRYSARFDVFAHELKSRKSQAVVKLEDRISALIGPERLHELLSTEQHRTGSRLPPVPESHYPQPSVPKYPTALDHRLILPFQR